MKFTLQAKHKIRRIRTVTYEVEADSEQDAIAKLDKGEGEYYISDNPDNDLNEWEDEERETIIEVVRS